MSGHAAARYAICITSMCMPGFFKPAPAAHLNTACLPVSLHHRSHAEWICIQQAPESIAVQPLSLVEQALSPAATCLGVLWTLPEGSLQTTAGQLQGIHVVSGLNSTAVCQCCRRSPGLSCCLPALEWPLTLFGVAKNTTTVATAASTQPIVHSDAMALAVLLLISAQCH